MKLLPECILLLGICAISAGVYLHYGLAISLMVSGVLFVCVAFVMAIYRGKE